MEPVGPRLLTLDLEDQLCPPKRPKVPGLSFEKLFSFNWVQASAQANEKSLNLYVTCLL